MDDMPKAGTMTVDEVVFDEDGTILQSRTYTIPNEDIAWFREAHMRYNYAVPQRFVTG